MYAVRVHSCQVPRIKSFFWKECIICVRTTDHIVFVSQYSYMYVTSCVHFTLFITCFFKKVSLGSGVTQ